MRHAARTRACHTFPPLSPVQAASTSTSYFVVKNIFQVKPDSFDAFEDMWVTRESRLKQMPGFMRFAMLRCTNVAGKYVSETHWATEADFKNWASRQADARVGVRVGEFGAPAGAPGAAAERLASMGPGGGGGGQATLRY
ncbi:hypothetical protein FOA52_000651 [Chlamydomonas sp. UWO 241]|nr:hypothetical protein FOA52_000651 [Chlamydomonas sp. UWO 241]